jgi:hypothetical protein
MCGKNHLGAKKDRERRQKLKRESSESKEASEK